MHDGKKQNGTDLGPVDAEIARLNAECRRYGYALVRRRKIAVHRCDCDGQPTGAPLKRFDATLPELEGAHEYVWSSYLDDTGQTHNNVRP